MREDKRDTRVLGDAIVMADLAAIVGYPWPEHVDRVISCSSDIMMGRKWRQALLRDII
jgi:hypothetical protein